MIYTNLNTFKSMKIITIIIFLFCTGPCEALPQKLTFNWPAKLKGTLIAEYGIQNQKDQGRYRYIKKEFSFQSAKSYKGYAFHFLNSKTLEVMNNKDLNWELLASVDNNCDFLVDKNGVFSHLIDFEIYKKKMLVSTETYQKNHPLISVDYALNFINDPFLRKKIENNAQKDWYYLIEFWNNKIFYQKTAKISSQNITLPFLGSTLYPLIKKATLFSVIDREQENLVVLEYKEYIEPASLPKFKHENIVVPQQLLSKFQQKSISHQPIKGYRYVITHYLVTDPRTLVPYTYVKTVEIILPKKQHFSIDRYVFKYDKP